MIFSRSTTYPEPRKRSRSLKRRGENWWSAFLLPGKLCSYRYLSKWIMKYCTLLTFIYNSRHVDQARSSSVKIRPITVPNDCSGFRILCWNLGLHDREELCWYLYKTHSHIWQEEINWWTVHIIGCTVLMVVHPLNAYYAHTFLGAVSFIVRSRVKSVRWESIHTPHHRNLPHHYRWLVFAAAFLSCPFILIIPWVIHVVRVWTSSCNSEDFLSSAYLTSTPMSTVLPSSI